MHKESERASERKEHIAKKNVCKLKKQVSQQSIDVHKSKVYQNNHYTA